MMGVDENFEFIPMMWWTRKAHVHEIMCADFDGDGGECRNRRSNELMSFVDDT
jgi:hypothetical protein